MCPGPTLHRPIRSSPHSAMCGAPSSAPVLSRTIHTMFMASEEGKLGGSQTPDLGEKYQNPKHPLEVLLGLLTQKCTF